MTAETTERPLTDAEIEKLTPRLTGFPTSFDELKEFTGSVLSFTFGLSFFFVVVWLLVDWLIGFFVDFDFGWNSSYGRTIFATIVFVALTYSTYELQRTNRPSRERIRSLQADIKLGKMIVERHKIKAAKVFQEPEHGALFYFLLTSDDRIYVALDYESADLYLQEKNPFDSSFQPKSVLRIEFTPNTRVPIVEEFEGEPIEIPETLAMTPKAKKWPEPESFIDVPWTEIESRYGA